MSKPTTKIKRIMMQSTTMDGLENVHNLYKLRVRLKDEKDLDMKYHKTINEIFNTIKEAGWSFDFRFTEKSEVFLTLESADNQNESKQNLLKKI